MAHNLLDNTINPLITSQHASTNDTMQRSNYCVNFRDYAVLCESRL
jgi:hypothetical protein